jgi:hypothetical protein
MRQIIVLPYAVILSGCSMSDLTSELRRLAGRQ